MSIAKQLDSPLLKFDKNINFWESNPQFKIRNPFRGLYEEDQTKNKEKSSRLMWGIVLLMDPFYSLYKSFPRDEKEKLIIKEWLNTEDFKSFSWGNYYQYVDAYEMLQTPARRALIDFSNKILDRAEFLRTTAYTLDSEEIIKGKRVIIKGTASQIDTMMINTSKIYAEYERVIKNLDQETDMKVLGQGQMSASEEGMI